MSTSQTDSTQVPLLFVDPVIEYYLTKVDRTAIREQLTKTPEERLQALERMAARPRESPPRVREEFSPKTKSSKLDMGVDPDWFRDAAAVPLLFPDPVVETYLEDVDRGLIREQLKLTTEERLRCLENMAELYEQAQRSRRERSSRV